MAKTKRKQPHAVASSQLGGAARTNAHVLGALILTSTLTTILPAFAQGAMDRTRAVAMLVVAVAWMLAWSFGFVRFTRQQVWWLAGVGTLGACAVLSAVTARFPVSALFGGLGTGMGAVQWLALAIIAIGASSVVLGRLSRAWIAATYAWVVPVAVVGIGQVTQGRPVTAGLLNDSLFGLVLVIWFAPALGLAFTSRRGTERWAWILVAAVLALAVLVSQARAASAGIVLELGLALAVMAPVAVPARRSLLRIGGLVVAAASTLSMLMVTISGILGASAPFASLGTTFLTRAYVYRTAVRLWSQMPVLGAGPDGFQLAAQGFVQPELMALEHGSLLVNATPADPHSLLLRLLAEVGVLGLLAFAVAVAGWLVCLRTTPAPSPQAGALRDGLGIGVAGFALASLASPWPVTIGASPAVVIGLAAASFGVSEPLRDVPRVVRWLAAGTISAVLLFVAWSGVAHYSAFLQAVDSHTQAQKQTALESARSAMPWSQEARFQVLWSRGMALESGVGDRAAFQRAVDADPLASAYAPLLAEFVRQSLVGAQRTGAADLSWERRSLATAAQAGPSIPEVAAERLHLALVGGDAGEIASALAATQGVAEPSEQYAAYATAAQLALGK